MNKDNKGVLSVLADFEQAGFSGIVGIHEEWHEEQCGFPSGLVAPAPRKSVTGT